MFADLLKNRHKKLKFLVLSFLLITFYQNCDGQLSTQSPTVSTSNSTSSSLGNMTSVPSAGGGTLTPAQAARLAACQSINGKPSLSASASALNIISGAGTGSGDMSASAMTVTANNGVTSTTAAVQNTCNFATNLTCKTVAGSAVLNYAIDGNGDEVSAAAMTADAKMAIIKNAFDIGNGKCAGGVTIAATSTSGTKTVTLSNLRQNTFYRCVQGSVTLQMNLETQIDNNNKNVSDPVMVTVNFQNGCWSESRLKDPAASFGKFVNFGSATAIDGNWAAVVAPRENSASVNTVGAVYMYQLVGAQWSLAQKLMIADASAGDSITNVALKGSKLVLSSENRGNKGAVFLYTLSGSTWTQAQVLNPPLNQDAQKFGEALAMNDSTLVVGAPEYSISGAANFDKGGAVYVYSCAATSCTYRYAIPSSEAGRGFGSSVALDGNSLVVGAPQALTLEADGMGFVEIYDISAAASLIKRLTPTDTASAVGMKFGASVAAQAGKILVGSPNKTMGASMLSGATYYYSSSSATPTIINGQEASGKFGNSVAFSSANYVVGCPYCSSGGGVVLVYSQANSTVQFKVLALNESTNDGFGSSIAVNGSNLLVGAFVKSDPNANSGAGFIYVMK